MDTAIMNLTSEALAVEIERNAVLALSEDMGCGDLTALLASNHHPAQGEVISRQDAILAGRAWFDACFKRLDGKAHIQWFVNDGEPIAAGQILCSVEANTRALLTAERSALNFLQMLSGTATTTRRYVDAIADTRACIVDTRKTIPGLRLAQKYAVRCGGGINHRLGLYDGILIKENHIIACGGISGALKQARSLAGHDVFIEVEVETLEELAEALDCGATLILLDNMTITQMHQAVGLTAGRAKLEASGGVRLATVRAIAETGVDRISIGCLTKDLRATDLSLRHIEQ